MEFLYTWYNLCQFEILFIDSGAHFTLFDIPLLLKWGSLSIWFRCRHYRYILGKGFLKGSPGIFSVEKSKGEKGNISQNRIFSHRFSIKLQHSILYCACNISEIIAFVVNVGCNTNLLLEPIERLTNIIFISFCTYILYHKIKPSQT